MTSQSEVRIATPRDEDGLMELCRMLHSETGAFHMDDGLVRGMLRRAFEPGEAIIGVIGEPSALEGSIYILISRFWYSYDQHLEELWNFVHPDHRRSGHAKALIGFAKKCSDELAIPLNIGVFNNDRTEAKVRLYERQLGKPAGAFFLYNSHLTSGPAFTPPAA